MAAHDRTMPSGSRECNHHDTCEHHPIGYARSRSCGAQGLMREPSRPMNSPINGRTTKNRKA